MKFSFLGLAVSNATIVGGASAFLVQTATSSRSIITRTPCASAALTAMINIDETASRDIATMEEWATGCGLLKSDGFQLVAETIDGNVDVSVTTCEDVPTSTTILYVPNEMILSSSKAMEEFGRLEDAEAVIVSNNAESELRQYYLMLKILVEYEQGENSPWFPWLNSLPRYFSNAASMTPFCYKCVPPLVASLAKQERATLNHLTTAGVKQRVPFLSSETKCNADLWVWAFQIVYTRSFEANDDSGDLHIIPMADMFNHGTETDIELVHDEYGNCFVQTTSDVQAGSPLSMSYGDPTNPSHLFARYGFLDETAPATFCKLIPTHVNEDMRNLGYAHNRMLFYKDTGDVSQEVWDILLYQFFTESGDLLNRQEFMKAHTDTDDGDAKDAIHERYYPETWAALRDHVDSFLNQLDELSEKTCGRDVNDHPRLPLIVRHNDFVRDTFLAVKARYALE